MIIKSQQYKAGQFYTAPKTPVEDKTLSWKAKGLLAYLLSQLPDREISTSELIKCSRDGETALRSGLAELERAGYLVRKRENDPQTKPAISDGWQLSKILQCHRTSGIVQMAGSCQKQNHLLKTGRWSRRLRS